MRCGLFIVALAASTAGRAQAQPVEVQVAPRPQYCTGELCFGDLEPCEAYRSHYADEGTATDACLVAESIWAVSYVRPDTTVIELRFATLAFCEERIAWMQRANREGHGEHAYQRISTCIERRSPAPSPTAEPPASSWCFDFYEHTHVCRGTREQCETDRAAYAAPDAAPEHVTPCILEAPLADHPRRIAPDGRPPPPPVAPTRPAAPRVPAPSCPGGVTSSGHCCTTGCACGGSCIDCSRRCHH